MIDQKDPFPITLITDAITRYYVGQLWSRKD
jgi:hypothetical protein